MVGLPARYPQSSLPSGTVLYDQHDPWLTHVAYDTADPYMPYNTWPIVDPYDQWWTPISHLYNPNMTHMRPIYGPNMTATWHLCDPRLTDTWPIYDLWLTNIYDQYDPCMIYMTSIWLTFEHTWPKWPIWPINNPWLTHIWSISKGSPDTIPPIYYVQCCENDWTNIDLCAVKVPCTLLYNSKVINLVWRHQGMQTRPAFSVSGFYSIKLRGPGVPGLIGDNVQLAFFWHIRTTRPLRKTADGLRQNLPAKAQTGGVAIISARLTNDLAYW